MASTVGQEKALEISNEAHRPVLRHDSGIVLRSARGKAVEDAQSRRSQECLTALNDGIQALRQRRGGLALESFATGVASARILGMLDLEALLLNGLGIVELRLGRAMQARATHYRALNIYRELEDCVGEGLTLAFIASVETVTGTVSVANSMFNAAEEKLPGKSSPAHRIIEILRGHAELALIRDAASSEERELLTERYRQRMQTAEAIIRGAEREAPPELLLAFASSSWGQLQRTESAPVTLEVGPDCRWFSIGGKVVDLSRRRPLRRLLSVLVNHHEAVPGEALSTITMFVLGWPEERLTVAAGRNRVRVAIATLRQMGLEEALVTYNGGYSIDRQINIVRHESALAKSFRNIGVEE